jgi:LacI family transcriptional regulator
MKTGLTNTVGVVVDDIKNPFYPELLDALTEVFDEQGMRVIIWKSEGGKSQAALHAIRQGLIDGIVFTTILEDSEPLHAALETGHPIVLVNRVIEGIKCDQVTSDNTRGGEQVADYFLDAGRSRIAYIGGPAKVSTSREREAGFRSRLADRNAPLDETSVRAGDYSYASGYESMRQLLRSENAPDAVFCCNDLVAFGALDCARELSSSPETTPWVVGYDNVQMAAWGAYGLSTVRQDTRLMAQTAAHLLLQRIKEPARPIEFVEYPSTLIVRSSTAEHRRGVKPVEPPETPIVTPGGVFVLRRALPADAVGIARVIQDDQHEHHGTTFQNVPAEAYASAFAAIGADPAQLLIAVRSADSTVIGQAISPVISQVTGEITGAITGEVVATMQLSFIPGMSRGGGTRLQIEAVLIDEEHRGQGLGTAMVNWALEEGRRRGAVLAQLTTATTREGTDQFYRRLGFEPTHVGFKISL